MATFSDKTTALRQAVLDFINGGPGHFADLMRRVHDYQRKTCAAYAAYCERFPALKSWREIPPLPLTAFRHARIACFPEDETVRTFRTSGTTGEGFGEHHFRTLDLYRAAALAGWKAAGIPDMPILGLVPSPADAPHSSLSCMAGWLVKDEDFYWQREEALRRRLEEAREPVLILGTALAFLDWTEKAEDIALPEGSMLLETGGYKGTQRSMPKEQLYEMLTAKFGVKSDDIWNEYGMTELSSQFYTRGLGRPHSGGRWVRALVIDPASGEEVQEGETGVLHIFDLANVDSCCAVQTRDMAVRQGDDFVLLGRDPAALPRGCSRAADDLLKR